MSSFMSLLALPEGKLAGSFHTAHEIAQQPRVWADVLALLESRAGELGRFLRASRALGAADATVLLTGAGSSDFIGRAVAGTLQRRLARQVVAVPTTHLVTHPESRFVPGRPCLVIHFARSGDSPESLAAYRALKRVRPDSRHLVITCNGAGALAAAAMHEATAHEEAAQETAARETSKRADPSTMVLVLPPATNDRSLAMTSSFTSMGLAAVGLGWLANGADPADPAGLVEPVGLADLRRAMDPVRAGAIRILDECGDLIERFASLSFDRACYLGSDALAGVMHEGALKMLEMTAGSVITASDSFLGVRHGPQVFINERCAVVACLSSDPRVRRYEIDLLAELRAKGQGCGILAISAFDDPRLHGITDNVVVLSPAGERIDDSLRVFSDIVACQVLAFHKSRACGLMPDNPSPGGVINRVVQGVTIYDP